VEKGPKMTLKALKTFKFLKKGKADLYDLPLYTK